MESKAGLDVRIQHPTQTRFTILRHRARRVAQAHASLPVQRRLNLGGTLIEEKITRAAGAEYGSYVSADELRRRIEAEGLRPVQRNTLYEEITGAPGACYKAAATAAAVPCV